MKKILLSAVMGSLFFVANADQTVVTAHEEPVIVVDQAPEAYECPFGGVYLGLGMGGSFYKNSGNAKIVRGADSVKTSYSGQNVNRFVGTLALGGAKVFKEKFYVGVEGMMDFTKSKKNTFVEKNRLGAVNVAGIQNENGGCIPSIGLRLGYVHNSWLIYGKVAASYASAKSKTTDGNKLASANKFAPALALGVEKAFCKKFTARLEGEYRFGSKKNFEETINGTKYSGSIKANKGFSVRALVAYNIKI